MQRVRTQPIRSFQRALALIALIIVSPAHAPAQQFESAADISRPSSRLSISAPPLTPNTVTLRIIPDPGSNALWLLSADPKNPSGPGRLERVELAHHQKSALSLPAPISTQESPSSTRIPNLTPIIRAGDHITIEHHTPALDARFTAIALSPARVGAHFDARLIHGGKPLSCIAISPGHALIAPPNPVNAFGAQ